MKMRGEGKLLQIFWKLPLLTKAVETPRREKGEAEVLQIQLRPPWAPDFVGAVQAIPLVLKPLRSV